MTTPTPQSKRPSHAPANATVTANRDRESDRLAVTVRGSCDAGDMLAVDPDTNEDLAAARDRAGRAAIERARTWWPHGRVPVDGAVPPVVAATRVLVVDALPTTTSQAGQALSHVARYLTWVAAHAGAGVDLAVSGPEQLRSALFTTDLLDRYRSAGDGLAGMPVGTARAAGSYLRRVATGPGAFAVPGCTRDPAATSLRLHTNVPTGAPDPSLVDPVLGVLACPFDGVDVDIAEALAAWTPLTLGKRAVRVAPFARAAVARSGPVSCRAAIADARVVAYLAAWVDAGGRPVRSDIVFDPDTISEFVSVLGQRLGPATAGTYRSVLARIVRTVAPDADTSTMPKFPRMPVRSACTDVEVSAALAWAKRRRRPRTRAHATALILLAVGAGLDGADSPWVRGEHVVDIEAGTGIEIWRPNPDGTLVYERTTFVLPRYVPAIQRAVQIAVDDDDGWLLGPGKRTSRINSLRLPGSGSHDLARLRNRWLTDVIVDGHLDVFSVMHAAGLTTLRTVEDLLGDVDRSGRLTALRRHPDAPATPDNDPGVVS